MIFRQHALLASAILCISATSLAQTPQNQVYRAEPPRPYELSPGTFISLTLEITNPEMVTAIVTTDIYDQLENIAIPRGSRLIGEQHGAIGNRRDIVWTGIQTPTTNGTVRLDPALHATMPDGSTGLINFKRAAYAGALTSKPIIIPH